MADEDRISRVARALCAADGQNPDAEIAIGTDETEPNATGISYRRTIRGPAWTSYVGEARRMIAAMIAVGVLQE